MIMLMVVDSSPREEIEQFISDNELDAILLPYELQYFEPQVMCRSVEAAYAIKLRFETFEGTNSDFDKELTLIAEMKNQLLDPEDAAHFAEEAKTCDAQIEEYIKNI